MEFRSILVVAALALALLRPAAAASIPEEASAAARERFISATADRDLPRLPSRAQETRSFGLSAIGIEWPDLNPFDRFLKDHTRVYWVADQNVGAAAAPQEIDLPALLNRHLKTSLAYRMGGNTVWLSGAFDRSQNAYVSVLEEGREARFFNVKSLLIGRPVIEIGTAQYRLSLSPVLEKGHELETEVWLTNTADKKDQASVTLKEMLDAVAAAGEELRPSGQVYRLFYFDDLKDAQADKSSRTLAFYLTDAQGQMHLFLVPAELVPHDRIAVFKMYQDKPVGLQIVGDRLRIYENP